MRAHLRFCVAALATTALAGGLAACSTSGTPGSSASGGGGSAADPKLETFRVVAQD